MNRVLTVEETAAYLQCSVRTVHELTRRREIPHRRVAGRRRVLFFEAELRQWLDGAKLRTQELGAGGRVVTPLEEEERESMFSRRTPGAGNPPATPGLKREGDS